MKRSVRVRGGGALTVAAGLMALLTTEVHAQAGRMWLVGYGPNLLRVWPNGVVEKFAGVGGNIWGMAVVPPGVPTTRYLAGDVLAVENNGIKVWIVNGTRAGTPTLQELTPGLPIAGDHADLAFAQGQLYVVNGGVVTQLDVSTFAVIQTTTVGLSASGGLAFDGVATWYALDSSPERLLSFSHPPVAGGAMSLGNLGFMFRNSDLDWSAGNLLGALSQSDGMGGFNMLLGTFDTTPGAAAFTIERTIFAGANDHSVGLIVFENQCYANCDGSTTPPVANVADFICFQTQFAAGNAYANCDNSTAAPILNAADFICFLNAFAAGCP